MANTKKLPSQKMLLAWEYYTNPASPTFDSVKDSGILAGFSSSYSHKGLYRSRQWREFEAERARVLEKYNTLQAEERRKRMLAQAEANLEEAVNSKSWEKEDKKIKHDATKFVASTLGREHYSTRNDVPDAGEGALLTGEGANAIASAFGKYLAEHAVQELSSGTQDAPKADYTVIEPDNE